MRLFLVFLAVVPTAAPLPPAGGRHVPLPPSAISVGSASPSALVYETKTVERRDPDCRAGDTRCAYITFQYPVIVRAPSRAAAEAINRAVNEFLLWRLQAAPFKDIDAEMDAFMQWWREAKSQGPPGTVAVYWQERTVKVLYQSPRIASLEFDEGSFTGGAHPNFSSVYQNFDAATGAQIRLGDILAPGYQAPLTRIAEQKFRQDKKLLPAASLRQAGYWFDDDRFRLTDNFAIGPAGLTFLYGLYAIAPYAMGITELSIAYGEIKDLIRPDGPLGSLPP